MANQITDCDHFVRVLSDPEARQKFFQDPDGMDEMYQFTSKTEHDLYASIDPERTPGLGQEGKVVLVTGAGRGIGREIAIFFAKAKAKGIVICARTLAQLEETKAEIHQANPDVEVLLQQVDVSSEKDVKSVFDAATNKFGTIGIAVSNAGVHTITTKLADTDTDEWWRAYEVHVKGLYLISKYFIKNLDENLGTLINISSTTSLSAIPIHTAYGPSKTASSRIVEELHTEYPEIRFFSLHPGIVDTELTRLFGTATKYGWKMDSPRLAAGTVLYLTTPRADFLRGRWISANWVVDELEQRREQIVGQNLLKSGFNASLRPGGHPFD